MKILKKIFILTPIILLSTLLIVVALNFKYFYTILSDRSGPEFGAPTGQLAAGPTVTPENKVYTITWATAQKYDNNEVLFNDGQDYSGTSADSVFDSATQTYRHSAIIQLTDQVSNESGLPFEPGKTAVSFKTGQYRYQVESYNYNTSDRVISAVQILND